VGYPHTHDNYGAITSVFPQDLVSARQDLNRIQGYLSGTMTSLSIDKNPANARQADGGLAFSPSAVSWGPDVAEQVSELRERQAELVEMIVGHEFWNEVDPTEVSAWNALHHLPEQSLISALT
jgi:hypothetical protein